MSFTCLIIPLIIILSTNKLLFKKSLFNKSLKEHSHIAVREVKFTPLFLQPLSHKVILG